MLMDRILLILSSLLLFTSCAEQYNIAGNSNIACLDGRMLYLRVSSVDKGGEHRGAANEFVGLSGLLQGGTRKV